MSPSSSLVKCHSDPMPLESCPTCGYALSVHDPHCRHCLPSRIAFAKAGLFSINALSDATHLSAMILVVLVLSGLAHLLFFR
jgi:hypothetical protein